MSSEIDIEVEGTTNPEAEEDFPIIPGMSKEESKQIYTAWKNRDRVDDPSIDDALGVVTIGAKNREEAEAAARKQINDQIEADRRRMQKNQEKMEKDAQAERDRERIAANKLLRKKNKKNASFITFLICMSSAIFMYIVTGVSFKLFIAPNDLIFAIGMGIIALIIVAIHVWAYRFIRQEIFRK